MIKGAYRNHHEIDQLYTLMFTRCWDILTYPHVNTWPKKADGVASMFGRSNPQKDDGWCFGNALAMIFRFPNGSILLGLL